MDAARDALGDGLVCQRQGESNGEENLEQADEVYATLENLARDNSLPGLASECFLGREDVQLSGYRRDGNSYR